MTQIIAFAGRKQSGKTTCSEFIVKYANGAIPPFNHAKVYNFADPLKKEICMNILGMTYEQCYGSDEQKNSLTDILWTNMPGYDESWSLSEPQDPSGYMTARQVMQLVGTNIFRKMKHNVWADATINTINREKPDIAVIADCRFPNEVESVKRAGGVVIKLNRNLYHSNHESEVALDENNYSSDNFDLVIHNESLTIIEQNRAILNFLKQKKVLS